MIAGGRLELTNDNMGSQGLILYDLHRVHVSSIDAPGKKNLCPQGQHHGVQMNLANGPFYRVYFLTFKEMQDFIAVVLTLQGFSSRLDQFLQDGPIHGAVNSCQRMRVQHRVTGDPYSFKVIPKQTAGRQLFQEGVQEVIALVRCQDSTHFAVPHDIFEDETKIYMAVKIDSDSMTLQEYLAQKAEPLSENSARKIIFEIAKALQKLHAKLIVHRDLRAQTVSVTQRGKNGRNTLRVRLHLLDQAFCFQKEG